MAGRTWCASFEPESSVKPVAVFLGSLLAATYVHAAQVPIVGYDIRDAVASGYGSWSHAYTGTIIPKRTFDNFGQNGVVADYVGGQGTLNDDVVGINLMDTQLFLQGNPDGSPISPVIVLKLATKARISRITLHGSYNYFNIFPGQITAVTVSMRGKSVPMATIDSGPTTIMGTPVDDIVELKGTPLEGGITDTIELRRRR
jgi:hypothetical protein